MNAVRMIQDVMSLNKALRLCEVSKKAWYYAPTPRIISPDPQVQEMVQSIAPKRPTYGTRRMAAQVSRELNRPVNRKAIQRIQATGLDQTITHQTRDNPSQQEAPATKSSKPVLGV